MEESLRALVEADVVERGARGAGQRAGVDRRARQRRRRHPAPPRPRLRARPRGADDRRDDGREFDLSVVQALLDSPAEAVIEALEEAIAAGLIVEVADAVDRFAFSHALARDAIYGRLSRTRRLRLHLRVATALEAARRERRRARPPLLRRPARSARAAQAVRYCGPGRRRGGALVRLRGRRRALPPRAGGDRRRSGRRRGAALRHPARARPRAVARRRRRRAHDVPRGRRERPRARRRRAARLGGARARRALLGGATPPTGSFAPLIAEVRADAARRGQHAARAAHGPHGREPALRRRGGLRRRR